MYKLIQFLCLISLVVPVVLSSGCRGQDDDCFYCFCEKHCNVSSFPPYARIIGTEYENSPAPNNYDFIASKVANVRNTIQGDATILVAVQLTSTRYWKWGIMSTDMFFQLGDMYQGGIYARNILNEQVGFNFDTNKIKISSTNGSNAEVILPITLTISHRFEFQWIPGKFRFVIDGETVAEFPDNDLFTEGYFPRFVFEASQGIAQVSHFNLGCDLKNSFDGMKKKSSAYRNTSTTTILLVMFVCLFIVSIV